MLGLNLNQISDITDLTLVHEGGVAEQVVGQLLKTVLPPYVEPRNYYWHRAEKGSNAELDYVIQHANQVIPIEVKAGSTGSLKSLHMFMGLKNLPLAVRFNSDIPTYTQVDVKNQTGTSVRYMLISLPFYLVGQIHRLIETLPQ